MIWEKQLCGTLNNCEIDYEQPTVADYCKTLCASNSSIDRQCAVQCAEITLENGGATTKLKKDSDYS